MTDSQRFFKTLKGVLTKNKRGFTAKNERRCRLKAKNNRFRSLLLILPLSVASMRRKMLKTTYTEEGSVTTIQSQKVAIYVTRIVIFKQIIQILQPIVIDYYSTHSYITNNSYFLLVLNTIHLKRRNSWPLFALLPML